MSLLTTKRPSRIPLIVASKSEPAEKISSGVSVFSDSRACALSPLESNSINQRLNTRSPATNEPIPDSDHSLNTIAALVELLAQAANVHVERACIAIVTVTPNTIQQLLSSYHAVRAACEHRQQRELLVREFDLHAVAMHADVVEVDHQVIVFIRFAHRLVSAAHDGAHACEQFAH